MQSAVHKGGTHNAVPTMGSAEHSAPKMAVQKHSTHDGQGRAQCSRRAVQSIEKEGHYRAQYPTGPVLSTVHHRVVQSTVPQKGSAQSTVPLQGQ